MTKVYKNKTSIMCMMFHDPKITFQKKLDYNDVLIVPQRTTLKSRSQVCLTRDVQFKHSRQQWSGLPVISSNMDTVTNLETFKLLKRRQMISCFPKYLNKHWIHTGPPPELSDTDYYMLSTGTNDEDITNVIHLISILKEKGIHPKFLCFDVANGYMINLINTCHRLRKAMPNVTFMAGNIVTPHGVKDLVVDGLVDIIKVGIGSGALCTTRKVTGVGYPQLSAVLECAEKAHELGAHIVADGGVTMVGDISKAFCAGGDFVMLGSMLAGHDSSPGDIITEKGKLYKITYGMSSTIANNKYAGGLKNYKTPEGKVVKMLCKGKMEDTLMRIEGGIRSTCTYIGAHDINEMSHKGSFIVVNNQYNNVLDSFVLQE